MRPALPDTMQRVGMGAACTRVRAGAWVHVQVGTWVHIHGYISGKFSHISDLVWLAFSLAWA